MRKAFILTGEKHFNPLPPHGGRRTRWRQSAETSRHFNPLPPHGGRQSSLNIFCIFNRHFNPLPPHGGRRNYIGTNPPYGYRISIHSLRMEGDYLRLQRESVHRHFNPLPPHGGRPPKRRKSAHKASNFNPLPPHGGRLDLHITGCADNRFQSTPSAWRETQFHAFFRAAKKISIHSLRMEGDMQYTQQRPRAAISIHSLRMEGDKINHRC